MTDTSPAKYIDVQVGTKFTADCDCGWQLETGSADELESAVAVHTDRTGHIWPTAAEAPEWW